MKPLKITINRRIVSVYVCGAITAFANTLYGTNRIIAYVFVTWQVLMLIYMFAKRRYIDYLGLYIIFCGLSMEYDKLVGGAEFYGFKNTRILGVNLGILSLIPLVLMSIKYFFIPKGKRLSGFYKMFMFLQTSAMVIGLLLITFNDNGVWSFPNVIRLYVDNLYTMCIQQTFLLFIFIMLVNEFDTIESLENYFLSLLVGVVLSLVISRLFGTRGSYGGVQTLIASNNARWLPMMLIIPIYAKYKNSIMIWLIGIVGAILVLLYNATGKMVILYTIVPFIYIFVSLKNKQYKRALGITIILPLLIIGIFFGVQKLAQQSILLSSKLSQALSLLDYFTGKIGTDDVSSSPRLRLYETGNIIQEYSKKPWLLLLGKGILGTVKNYTNMSYHAGAYSDIQWQTGLFFRMHESINKLLLANGLAGIWFLFVTTKNGIKDIAKTPFGAIGLYWLLICYGHSITMTAFGFSCLVYSLIQADKVNGIYEVMNNENISY